MKTIKNEIFKRHVHWKNKWTTITHVLSSNLIRVMVAGVIFLLGAFFPPLVAIGDCYPVSFIDTSGRHISIVEKPRRIVSLVPSITEILFGIGANHQIVGITYHSNFPAETTEKTIVGGYFNPRLELINNLDPDIVFYSDMHGDLVEALGADVIPVNLSAQSIEESLRNIDILGRISGHEKEAEAIIADQQRLIQVIEKKTAKIPDEDKFRVIRLMEGDSVMVPGDDSFQNQFIRMAGGIAPQFGRNGEIIPIGREEWQEFNPQVIYSCGKNRQLLSKLEQLGLNNVDAVKDNRVLYFPCDLTCRASTRVGDFISLLSAQLYLQQFSEPANQVVPDQVVSRTSFELDFDYIVSAEKIESDIRDFRHRTILIAFKSPMAVLSSLEGWRDSILNVGNHYFPPPSWGLGHEQGLDGLRSYTLKVLGESRADTALLFTGADMNNLAVASHTYREMRVTALVTAGVLGNAVRMGSDEGGYYELTSAEDRRKPGTINIMVFTNTRLSSRAMTRALISCTEAKSAALQDLDIRSSYSSMVNAATGTGTDNILVVQGDGPEVDASGGHTKMGELIAKAVYDGVSEAVLRQNGLTSRRSVFQRLKERNISIWHISRQYIKDPIHFSDIETLLLESRYQSYIAAAFAISDDYQKGLIKDLSAFRSWSRDIADTIAEKPVEFKMIDDDRMPIVLRIVFSAFVSGINTN